MKCHLCGHAADDHTFSPAIDPRYCTVSMCKCTGWKRADDGAMDFTWGVEEDELKRLLRKLNSGGSDKGRYVVVWENGKPVLAWWPKEEE